MIRLKKKTWRHDNKDDEMKQEIKMLATLGILSLSLPACSGDNGETGGDNINPSVKSETMVGKNTSNEKSETMVGKNTSDEKSEPKEKEMSLKDAIASLKTPSPFSEHADAFFKSQNVLTYGLTYEDDDVENEKPTGFFINVNDASVIDSDGKRDLKAFKASLKENTLGELSDEDMEGLFESLINIASESLTMFLTEDSSPAPNEKSAK
tara:strand:- start:75507 stop:76133 length:627 start_codon:yes stop_codon:yes gene_type:complete